MKDYEKNWSFLKSRIENMERMPNMFMASMANAILSVMRDIEEADDFPELLKTHNSDDNGTREE
jgi:hypothetical protein